MLHRLCRPPSISLSFNRAAVLPRRMTERVSCATQALSARTASHHRLRRGLPGYLILFAPHAFAPQRQYVSSESPSPLVFFRISTNFTSTLGIPLTSPQFKRCSLKGNSGVEPRAFTSNLQSRLRALYAQ